MTAAVQRERSANGSHATLDQLRGERREIDLSETSAQSNRVYWSGEPWQLGTAAYWEDVARSATPPSDHRLGRTLEEEVAACILGGYGVPFETGNAALQRLIEVGALNSTSCWSASRIELELQRPLLVRDRQRRYRFPRQRAQRIQSAMSQLRLHDIPADDLELRALLLTIPGIGPKTASWVVRNFRASDAVAVVDIHIVRAGLVAGIFSPDWKLPKHYDAFETAFLTWANRAGLRPSTLDAVVWGALAHNPRAARDILGRHANYQDLRPVWPGDAD